MDMRDLESEVQRLVGYDCLVTSGLSEKGPYININGRKRMLKIWIPRTGTDPKKIASMVRGYMDKADESVYKEMEYK